MRIKNTLWTLLFGLNIILPSDKLFAFLPVDQIDQLPEIKQERALGIANMDLKKLVQFFEEIEKKPDLNLQYNKDVNQRLRSEIQFRIPPEGMDDATYLRFLQHVNAKLNALDSDHRVAAQREAQQQLQSIRAAIPLQYDGGNRAVDGGGRSLGTLPAMPAMPEPKHGIGFGTEEPSEEVNATLVKLVAQANKNEGSRSSSQEVVSFDLRDKKRNRRISQNEEAGSSIAANSLDLKESAQNKRRS